MNKEEFLNHIRSFEASTAKYEALSEKYNQQMPDALTDVAVEHLPELQNEKEKFKKIITPIALKFSDEIWEEFSMADWINHSKEKVTLYKVPKPKTKDEEEQELLEELKDIPEEYHEKYKEMARQSLMETEKYDAFVHGCHKKIKEVFTTIYFDDVLSLDSDYLRYFDNNLYMQALEFVEEIYAEYEENG